jgi:hypothetical protein
MSGTRLTVPISQNAKFSFRCIAVFKDDVCVHNPVNSAEISFSNHKCVCRLEIVALQNQKVLQRSNYHVSEHRVHYEAEFWLSNKRFFCKQKKRKTIYFCHFVCVCVILSGIAQF